MGPGRPSASLRLPCFGDPQSHARDLELGPTPCRAGPTAVLTLPAVTGAQARLGAGNDLIVRVLRVFRPRHGQCWMWHAHLGHEERSVPRGEPVAGEFWLSERWPVSSSPAPARASRAPGALRAASVSSPPSLPASPQTQASLRWGACEPEPRSLLDPPRPPGAERRWGLASVFKTEGQCVATAALTEEVTGPRSPPPDAAPR